MTPSDRQRRYDSETAALYEAVGLFCVKFEHLTLALQHGIVHLLEAGGLRNQRLVQVLLADLTIYPLKSMLQALIPEVADLEKEDTKLVDAIFSRTQDLIELRNETIHATWFIGLASPEQTEFTKARGVKLKRGKKGAVFATSSKAATDFAAYAEECEVVSGLIRRLSIRAAEGHRISSNFKFGPSGAVAADA